MEKPREDRRVRRTRRLLKQGLAELMREKDFQDITVKDITERMDLNRGTFYLHYTDTYDLLEKLENETLADFQEMIDANRPALSERSLMGVIEPILAYVVENADICKSLFENKASNDFTLKFHRMVCENGVEVLRASLPAVSQEKWDYFFSFNTYGLIGVIRHWFDSGMNLDQHALAVLCDQIITASAGCLLDQKSASGQNLTK